jgi:nucleotide-binding universal stress UspA family protein
MLMLCTILVGVDGTTSGEMAFELALRWAARADAMVVGLGIVDEPGLHGPEEALVGERFFAPINAALLKESRQKADRVLERCTLRCAERGVAFKPLEDVGVPSEAILAEAQRYDLVVLGRETHFRQGWEGTPDDTFGLVLAGCPRPVVGVAPNPPESGPTLVAYDGSVQAARALAAFVATGVGKEEPLHVLSVGRHRRDAALVAERAMDYLCGHRRPAEAKVVESGQAPAEVILDTAHAGRYGLVVMGALGQPRIREILLGSTTRSVLKGAGCPVFLYH